MRILVVAEGSPGVQLLRALAREDDTIVAVMTRAAHAPTMSDVAAVAKRMSLDVWPASLVREPRLAATIRSEQVDLILNAHSLDIFHDDVLASPRIGAFNLHPGPLPEYSGLNCPSWAILHGERTYGVTVHRMVPRIDAGAIAWQEDFEVGDDETALSLSLKCIRAGITLVLRLVAAARTDPARIPAIEQDLDRRCYFGRETPRGGALTWSEPAALIHRFVRAFDYHPFPPPWGHPHARSGDNRIGIVRVALTGRHCSVPPGSLRRTREGGLEVATTDEWLELNLLHLDGRYVTGRDALARATHLEDGIN